MRARARRSKEERFIALLHHVTPELLWASYPRLKREAAPGVDGLRWRQYGGEGVRERIVGLHARIHRGSYRAQPVRRVHIPKPDGRQRPLGIAALEDKIVQQAVATVLNAIYEEDFHGFSYGFRPGRGAHDALDALYVGIMVKKVGWVLDADISGFFDNLNHEWLMRFLQRRIADARLLRLVAKWLRAGVSEAGQWSEVRVGTPQGAVISPLLANIYLHYVLDEWLRAWRREQADGEMIAVRYADDVVFGFERRGDAVRFREALEERLREHGLALHPAKTRLIRFGRFAEARSREHGEGKPETFDFLGFTHYGGRTQVGRYIVRRRTMAKRMRATLAAVKVQLRQRWHRPKAEVGAWLGRVVNGYYRYHAVSGNLPAMARFRHRVARLWWLTLRRRGRRMSLGKFIPVRDRWLPQARVLHPYPSARFAARHPRWEPDAGKPLVRFCPGGAP